MNRVKTAENDQIDIGWNEGVLSDGRPYRIELWAQDQITSVTVFLSTEGIETYSNHQFFELLEKEHIVWWTPGAKKSAYALPLDDASGNPMWSINVVIGADDGPPVADAVPVLPYSRASGIPPGGRGDS
ncbi:MAG: hypothetical protein ACREND_06460 [Gemmatimonadaceae bacterium]